MVKHRAKNGHTVISISEAHTNYLEGLNISYKSLASKKKNLHIIEEEITLLIATKETAIKDLEASMKFAHDQIEQRKNDLMKHIANQFNVQHNALQDKQKQIQEAIDVLNKNITEAKNITKAGYVSKLKSITECLKKVNTETEAILSRLDLGENCLLFDSNKGVEEFNNSLSALGQVCTKGFLPSMSAFKDTEAKTGLTTTLTLEVYNHQGDKFPIPSDSLSVQVTDPLNRKVYANLCKTGLDYTVTFLPLTAGLYEASVMFQGQRVNSKQSHISVTSNNPVLKFGKFGHRRYTGQVTPGIRTMRVVEWGVSCTH